VFVQGGHDPWSAGGYYGAGNPTLPRIFIETGAHHVDLMFSRKNDPQDVVVARAAILEILTEWFKSKSEDGDTVERSEVS
jgi:lysosomal Pro-X carboxypeptidase